MKDNLVGINVKIQMSRTLYIEVPEGTSDEDIRNKAKSEIKLPEEALDIAIKILKERGLKINGLDLKDWGTDSVIYNILQSNNNETNNSKN